MGFKEIHMATDSQLKHELSIKELGLRLSLKQFCASQVKKKRMEMMRGNKKKQRLIELIEGNQNTRFKGALYLNLGIVDWRF